MVYRECSVSRAQKIWLWSLLFKLFSKIERAVETYGCYSSAIADHMTQTGHRIKWSCDHMSQTGHRIKWDHFDILATGQSDIHCKIKETLLIRELKPALNENVGTEKLLLYQPFIFFQADLTRSVYFHCHYFPYLVLAFMFKFNCTLGNRYF